MGSIYDGCHPGTAIARYSPVQQYGGKRKAAERARGVMGNRDGRITRKWRGFLSRDYIVPGLKCLGEIYAQPVLVNGYAVDRREQNVEISCVKAESIQRAQFSDLLGCDLLRTHLGANLLKSLGRRFE